MLLQFWQWCFDSWLFPASSAPQEWWFLLVFSKGDDLLMSSLVSGVSSKDINIKTQYLYTLGIEAKLHDVFPMPEFFFKRLHTEAVQWRMLAGASLHCLKFAVNVLVAWRMVQVLSPVTPRGACSGKHGSLCWRAVKPFFEHVPKEGP